MKQINRLDSEKSLYLKQHADNPVLWYPWGDEAFAEAKRSNKPIMLSIGYSACHWCHVMAHESFEDQETADILNNNFINIKVDREERPDIDKIYQMSQSIIIKYGLNALVLISLPLSLVLSLVAMHQFSYKLHQVYMQNTLPCISVMCK